MFISFEMLFFPLHLLIDCILTILLWILELWSLVNDVIEFSLSELALVEADFEFTYPVPQLNWFNKEFKLILTSDAYIVDWDGNL